MKHKKDDLILREEVMKQIAEWISSGESHACMSNFFLTDRIKNIECIDNKSLYERVMKHEKYPTTIEIKRETSEPNDRIRITTSGVNIAFDVPKTL